MINKKAFTLTEVLIALVIIGAIGGLTLPSLLGNSNEKMFDTKYENTKQQIHHVVLEQMILNKTKRLEDTDFSNIEAVLGKTTTIFDIVPPKCDSYPAEGMNCTEGTAFDIPGFLAQGKIDPNTNLRVSDSLGFYYIAGVDESGNITNVGKKNTPFASPDIRTAILKNGVCAMYYYHEATKSGAFIFDLNNTDGPNIIGKDLRGLVITSDGKIYDVDVLNGSILSVAHIPG